MSSAVYFCSNCRLFAVFHILPFVQELMNSLTSGLHLATIPFKKEAFRLAASLLLILPLIFAKKTISKLISITYEC